MLYIEEATTIARTPAMASSNCPSREQLSAYVVGLLPEESFEIVAQHIDECPACEATVQELEVQTDTIISLLQQPRPVDTYAGETGCQKALALVEAMGHDPSFFLDTSYTSTEPPLGTIRVYRLLEKLGQGGMGAVYKALHTELDKVVAVKVIAPDRLADASAVSRFKREMKAVGKLEHPHIVRAFDAGEENGRHYLVMEYVPGCDAGKLVDRLGPLPVADACEIVRQAALGLQHAHGHGLIHRDVKPSNLMLVGEATPLRLPVEPASVHLEAVVEQAAAKRGRFAYIKILDLGLALLQDQPRGGSSEITAERQLMGTLDYMAPEQAGNSHEVDGRADIYSLGAALYKLTQSGQAPSTRWKSRSRTTRAR
jgi:serine/threonine protein kinase